MDFSKIKKIFYIVAIISMLLSIKSKVLGAVIEFDNNNTPISFMLPDFIEENNLYFFCTFSKNGTTNYVSFFFSDVPLTITQRNSTQYYFHSSSKYKSLNYRYTSQDLSAIQNNLDNLTLNSFSNGGYTDIINSFYFTKSVNNSNGVLSYVSNYDVMYNNSVYYSSNYTSFIAPSFDDPTEIENGNPDGVYITPGDYSRNDNLYFHLLQIDTGLSNSDASIYYYSDKTFVLNKDSEYFRTWVDPNIEGYYYYIPRYKLGLSQNTSYLYVLNNSQDQIQNSQGIYAEDIPNGIYDVVQSDTAGVITATEEQSDRMKNIEQSLVQNQETTNSINDTLTNTTVPEETETDIDSSLNFSNNAPQFSSLFNGYFSRLTSIISDLGNYQDTDVITVNLPIPFTNDTIPISSNFIFSNQNNNFLRNIATLLWYFIFGRYFLYFLINTYWLITNGQFFDNYLTQKEAITGDML